MKTRQTSNYFTHAKSNLLELHCTLPPVSHKHILAATEEFDFASDGVLSDQQATQLPLTTKLDTLPSFMT
jgi:hypothetical protein